ncbi:MAG: selenide, water dikinase SelD [Bdellovibrio sp.]
MRPLSNVKMILISDQDAAPYSGMLPGYMMGKYPLEKIHFNLWKLTSQAGILFIRDRIKRIDKKNKLIFFESERSPLFYDVLSINIGITPKEIIADSKSNIIPLKPISSMVTKWELALEQLKNSDRLKLAVVGGGPAGIETASALATRIKELSKNHEITLFHQGTVLGHDLPQKAQSIISASLLSQGIHFELNAKVHKIENGKCFYHDRQSDSFDLIFLATPAQAPAIFKNSHLTTNPEGFLSVNKFLQSVDDPSIFAAGDCIDFTEHSLPKAGVFAVRQGMILSHNVRQFAQGKENPRLLPFVPQKKFLKLIHISPKKILASRGMLNSASSLFWPWKKMIDLRFMHKFGTLPLTMSEMERNHEFVNTCGGCGAKISNSLLSEVIGLLKLTYSNELPTTIEDCYPVNSNDSNQLISVDGLRAFIQDPFIYGKISTLHALSDLWVSGVRPHTLVVSVGLAHRQDSLQRNFLIQVMSGILSVCQEHQIKLANAHTFENAEDHLSLTVLGAPEGKLIRKGHIRSDQIILMSKKLGTGIALNALMKADIEFYHVKDVIDIMFTPNSLTESERLHVSAGTDITGFGLIGHLLEMLAGSHLGIKLDSKSIPYFDFTEILLERGHRSFLIDENKKAFMTRINGFAPDILFDPQTNGPLVIVIERKDLEKFDQKKWTVIGSIQDDRSEKITLI